MVNAIIGTKLVDFEESIIIYVKLIFHCNEHLTNETLVKVAFINEGLVKASLINVVLIKVTSSTLPTLTISPLITSK